jgi:hypothetical protein
MLALKFFSVYIRNLTKTNSFMPMEPHQHYSSKFDGNNLLAHYSVPLNFKYLILLDR